MWRGNGRIGNVGRKGIGTRPGISSGCGGSGHQGNGLVAVEGAAAGGHRRQCIDGNARLEGRRRASAACGNRVGHRVSARRTRGDIDGARRSINCQPRRRTIRSAGRAGLGHRGSTFISTIRIGGVRNSSDWLGSYRYGILYPVTGTFPGVNNTIVVHVYPGTVSKHYSTGHGCIHQRRLGRAGSRHENAQRRRAVIAEGEVHIGQCYLLIDLEIARHRVQVAEYIGDDVIAIANRKCAQVICAVVITGYRNVINRRFQTWQCVHCNRCSRRYCRASARRCNGVGHRISARCAGRQADCTRHAINH